MNQKFRTWSGRLCLALFFLTAACWGQTKPGPDSSVRFLYPIGKAYKSETVVPLVLELSNNTSKERTYTAKWSLEIPIPDELVGLRLKPGDKKRFPLFFPRHTVDRLYNFEVNGQPYPVDLQTNSRSSIAAILSPSEEKFDYLRSLKLEVDQNAVQAAAATPPPTPGQPVDPPKTSWIALTDLANLEPELLPESWAPLASLDTIIVYDLPSLSLTQGQKEALMNWCLRGGRLVLVSDGEPNEYKGTPFESYLPMTPTEVVTDDGLTQLVGTLHPKAEALASHAGRPLLLRREALDGKLFLITAPLKELSPLSTEQAEKLWRQVLPEAPDPATGNYNSYNPSYNSHSGSNYLRDIPELPRAQAGWLAIYLLTYALIVGPLNLGVLRKKDKMLWSFVTVPVIAVAFAGGAYLINLAGRSSVPVLRELGTLRLKSGETLGHSRSDALFFSPSARRYAIDCDPKVVCQPGLYSYDDRIFGMYQPLPDGGLQAGITLSTWDVYALEIEALMQTSGPITGRWDSKTLTLDSAMESAADEAILYNRKEGVSQPFTLKKGKESYPLSFNSSATYDVFAPIATTNKEHPGRDELLNGLSSAASQQFKEDATYLLFWTTELQSKVNAGEKTAHKAEYLVVVELES